VSDFARLEEKLAKLRLRERGAGEARVIRGDARRLLAAALTEIDETILPRDVSFSAEGGMTLHLAVANRRLQALVGPVPNLEGAGDLDRVPLTDPEGDTGRALSALLLAAFATADSWVVQSTRPAAGAAFASDVGIPAAILMRAWGASAHSAAAPEERLRAFMSGLGDRAGAWILIEGEEVSASHGPAAAVAALGDHAAVILDGYFAGRDALLQGETGPAALAYGAGEGGRAVVVRDAGTALGFAVLREPGHAAILSEWLAEIAL
jgi:hypothetical protein